MSEKLLDKKGRFRSITIGFRVSPEENEQISRMVMMSGLTKQDYLTNNMLQHSIIVQGNPRVYKGLKTQMEAICRELSRLSAASEISTELSEVMETAFSILADMNKEE